MKNVLLTVLFAIAFSAVSFGQVKEISEANFSTVQAKAESLLNASSYRLTVSMEYFVDRDKPGSISRTFLKEVILPDKWRTVEAFNYEDGTSTKEETLWDGKALFTRTKDGEWKKYSGGASVGGRIESGKITNTYRFIGNSDLNGTPVSILEHEQYRIANKYSRSDMVIVHYLRKTRYYYSNKGYLMRKIEENEIVGRKELSRETSNYEYDPKIKIVAPIK